MKAKYVIGTAALAALVTGGLYAGLRAKKLLATIDKINNDEPLTAEEEELLQDAVMAAEASHGE